MPMNRQNTNPTNLSTYPPDYTNTILHSYQRENLRFYTVRQGSKHFPGARKVTRGRFHTVDPQIPRATEQNSGARDLCISLYTINVHVMGKVVCWEATSENSACKEDGTIASPFEIGFLFHKRAHENRVMTTWPLPGIKWNVTLEIQYKMIFTLKKPLENLDQMTSVSQASSEGQKGEWEKKKRSSEGKKEEKVTTQLTLAVFWYSQLTRISSPQCANCQ
jgi:hypothetical protein